MKKLDKVMTDLGFKIVYYPINFNEKAKWYVLNKVPYSSAISEHRLIRILTEVEASGVLK